MNIEEEMYKRATSFIENRFSIGWGGAAVIHTDDDKYLISVAHCICVVRDDEKSPFKVLSPCGVCQERLRYWGEDVKVAVTTKDNVLKFVTLKELQPFHWTGAYPKEELDHYVKTKIALDNK